MKDGALGEIAAAFAERCVAGVLTVRARAETPLRLPEHKGSVLRSVLFRALRGRLCTISERAACEGCPEAGRCPFPPLAEPGAWPVEHGRGSPLGSLVPRPPQTARRSFEAGAPFGFSLVLLGERALGTATAALAGATDLELGEGGGRLAIEAVESRPARVGKEASTLAAARALFITLRTPLRARAEGRVGGWLSADVLFRSVHRRLRALAVLHGLSPVELPPFDALLPLPELGFTALRWAELERFSRRQSAPMRLGGFLGQLRASGRLEIWGPLLAVAALTHVGNATSFGLGRISVAPEGARQPSAAAARSSQRRPSPR